MLPAELLGIYLNPDEIEAKVRLHKILSIADFGVTPDISVDARIYAFFNQSKFLHDVGLSEEVGKLRVTDGQIDFSDVMVNSYFASVVADFLRQELMKQKVSFTLETVMSSPDKVRLLERAQQLGYRTYLYFIATDDPEINISRVQNRVKQGGHPVPEDKIVQRYHRSLELLIDAIRYSNRAYVFDNSGHNQNRTWLAEITDGVMLEIKIDQLPAWFIKSVLENSKTSLMEQ